MNEPYAGTSRAPRPRFLDRTFRPCSLPRSLGAVRLAALLALLAVSLAACGTSGSGQTVAGATDGRTPQATATAPGAAASASSGPASVPSATPSSTASSTSSPSGSPSRREFAQIESTDAGHWRVSYERDEFFMGNAATVAARQDRVIGANQELPEPLYVRDLHQRATLPVARNAVVSVISTDANGSPTLAPVDAAAFLQNFTTFDQSPYFWLTVVGGQVTRIDQQYVG